MVVRAYLEWGADCAKRLEGIFAFAVWDLRRGELVLVRDRLGVKPLFYANREPKRITVEEVFLDRTDTGESITDDIDGLLALQHEVPKLGRPPALLLIYGDRQQRVVLEEVTITEQWFSPEGNPQRAKLSLQLVEIQEDEA